MNETVKGIGLWIVVMVVVALIMGAIEVVVAVYRIWKKDDWLA